MTAAQPHLWSAMLPAMLALVFGAPAGAADASPPKSAFVAVNGARLHYVDWGGQGDSLLFLHGMADTPRRYDDFAPRFTGQFRVLGLARRGHGESEIPRTGYDLASLVEDIRQFLDALKIRRVVLAGHSFAGRELTGFAAAHPDRVIKLVYFDAAYDHSRVPENLRFQPLHGGRPEVFPTEAERGSPDGARRWIIRLFGDERGTAIHSVMESSYSTAADYGKIKVPTLAFFNVGYPEDVDRARAMPEPGRGRVLELLEAQRRYHEDEIEHFRKEMPSARVVVFTNATHTPFVERADDVFREMRVFLGQVVLDNFSPTADRYAVIKSGDREGVPEFWKIPKFRD